MNIKIMLIGYHQAPYTSLGTAKAAYPSPI